MDESGMANVSAEPHYSHEKILIKPLHSAHIVRILNVMRNEPIISTREADMDSANSTSPSAQRITLDLSPSAAAELDRLRALTGLTKTELFRHGFNLLRLYVKAAQEGKELSIIDPSGRERVIQLPIVVRQEDGLWASAKEKTPKAMSST
jgi:hypothetical protein